MDRTDSWSVINTGAPNTHSIEEKLYLFIKNKECFDFLSTRPYLYLIFYMYIFKMFIIAYNILPEIINTGLTNPLSESVISETEFIQAIDAL